MAETPVIIPEFTNGVPTAAFTDNAGNFVQMTSLVDGSGQANDVIGNLNAPAAASDTAAASLNGRLQRIAQNITALAALSGGQVAPGAGAASAIVTGGTAVTLVTGPCNGGYIVNPVNNIAQGIAGVPAENAYIDPVGTPGSTDATANGTTLLLQPGQQFDIPPLETGHAIKGNAATTGHQFTVVVW